MKVILSGLWKKGEILSGPEKYAKRLFNNLDCERSFITCVSGGRFNIYKRLFAKTENEKDVFSFGLLRMLAFALKFKPDIIHTVNFSHGFVLFLFLLKPFLRAKYIYTMHGLIDFDSVNYNFSPVELVKFRLYEKIFIKYSDAIIAFSEESVKYASKKYEVAETCFTLLEHGIDDYFFAEAKRNNETLKIAAYAGHSKDYKGMDNVLAFLYSSGIKFEFYILGSELPVVNKSENQKIINKGFLQTDELSGLFNQCDIFIMGSPGDTFSIITLEAMAAGCVPLITLETGISRIIKEKINGFVYNFGEIDRPAEVIRFLDNNREKLEEIRKNNIAFCRRFTWKRAAENHFELYENLINE